jgi:lipopolysaccharide transport system ATP-binding protein
MRPVIKAQNVSKKFTVGARGAVYSTLRDTVADTLKTIRNFRNRPKTREARTVWAVKDVNFDIEAGQVVGIVGRNGAGKSTLLKIISRITEPTTGRIDLYARTGSLLEVGTGFHPELTGRENVYLNGAILGMRKVDIARKFDEIVAFSEIEKFIDTPVKFYSSGMYVRLAFSVAAHLEPEILIVDEVLSVGDMAFQQKCLQRLRQMREEMRAIILVSHNMIAIRAICSRVMLLSKGQLTADGEPDDVVPLYEKLIHEAARESDEIDEVAQGMGQIQIKSVKILDEAGVDRRSFEIGEKLSVVVEYDAIERVDGVVIYSAIRRPDDFICVATSTKLEGITLPPLEGPGLVTIEIPELLVIPGHYVLDIVFYDHNYEYRAYFLGRKRIEFNVTSEMTALDGLYGVYYQKQNWKVEFQISDLRSQISEPVSE